MKTFYRNVDQIESHLTDEKKGKVSTLRQIWAEGRLAAASSEYELTSGEASPCSIPLNEELVNFAGFTSKSFVK